MEHGKKPAVHAPVVLLKLLEGVGRRSGEGIGDLPVIRLEKRVQLFGNGKNQVKMRTIRETLAHVLGPLRLTRTEAIRAMPVAAGTRIPLVVTTFFAPRLVESERSFPAMGNEVERRILPL